MIQEKYQKRIEKAKLAQQKAYERRLNRQKSKISGYSIIDRSYNLKEGVVKPNIHNSPIHELAKFKLQFKLMMKGYKCYSECIFKNKSRADIYCPEQMEVYEVLFSETVEEFEEKKKRYYPELLSVYRFKATDILKDGFEV